LHQYAREGAALAGLGNLAEDLKAENILMTVWTGQGAKNYLELELPGTIIIGWATGIIGAAA